jgi:alpha-D-xyloside xylohydrolase
MTQVLLMPYQPPLIPQIVFGANPPELPARSDQATAEYVIHAQVSGHDQRGVSLKGTTNCGNTVNASVSVAAPGIVRVTLHGEPGRRVPLARDLSGQPVEVRVEQSDGLVRIVEADVRVTIRLDPFNITYDGVHERLLAGNATDTDVTDRLITLPFGFTDLDGRRFYHDSFTAEPDEHYYGFGEKFTDFDKRGQRIEMWHYDAYGVHSERSYKNVPFFVSTRGYGVFVDSHTPVRFDMASSNHSIVSIIVPDTMLDYYIITGDTLKTVVSRYADLVSHPILPPKWAFGLWMSSGFQRDSADDVLARAHELREHDIPTDVLHLDCFWQKHGRWSDLQWDRDLFPNPADLIDRVHEVGFKVCLWINSYIGIESPLYEQAKQQGYFLRLANGETWVGDLWGGMGHFHPPVSIMDVTNPDAAAWYTDMLRDNLRLGADVFKTDFGEGVPAETVAYNGMTGLELHNLYPLLYNDLVADVTREVTGGPGMVWGRSTYAGGQRHAAQWGGDPNCTFPAMASTLRGGLSMAMVGHAFWSHDIGGFHRQPTPELFVRWAQMGFFSPLSRAHGMTTRLPWEYGETVERIFRQYAKLRYHLLPYINSMAVKSHRTGLPLIRPLVLEYSTDPSVYGLDLQYLFGDSILVAPIFNEEGRRSVYFPAGAWIDYWTGELVQGATTRYISVRLDVLPLYIKVDSLIPTTEPKAYVGDEPFDLVTVDAYLENEAAFDLQDTDGLTSVHAMVNETRLVIRFEGVKQQLGFRLMPLPANLAVNQVLVNGEPLDRSAWSRSTDEILTAKIVQRS